MGDKGLQLIEWPSNSPDLNIIEHVWHRLKSEIRRTLKSERKEVLLEAVNQAWNSLVSSPEIQNLYASMPKRIAACISAKGGHTQY